LRLRRRRSVPQLINELLEFVALAFDLVFLFL
jgi:hypothetical protein